MSEISEEEAQYLAASLISGIRNSLLLSMENDEKRENKFIKQKLHTVDDDRNTSIHNSLQNTNNHWNKNRCKDRHKNKKLSRNEVSQFHLVTDNMREQKALLGTSSVSNEINTNHIKKTTNGCNMTYGKKCPKCFEINDKDANWCMECGKAIISVEIRRCDSLEESCCSPQLYKSQSFPIQSNFSSSNHNSFEFEEDLLSTTNSIQFQPNVREGSRRRYNTDLRKDLSATFDFQNPQFDDDYCIQHTNTAVYRKASFGESKDFSQLYAFDDLLYPNYAIHDAVLGYVFPSSNIVSNGAVFHPQLQNDILSSSFEETFDKSHQNKVQHKYNKQLKWKSRNKVCIYMYFMVCDIFCQCRKLRNVWAIFNMFSYK